jgi:hypothetical protein
VPTIDRADLITEADLDEEPDENDDLANTGDCLEDIETLYSYVVDSRDLDD